MGSLISSFHIRHYDDVLWLLACGIIHFYLSRTIINIDKEQMGAPFLIQYLHKLRAIHRQSFDQPLTWHYLLLGRGFDEPHLHPPLLVSCMHSLIIISSPTNW
jgi:hypothetical protein